MLDIATSVVAASKVYALRDLGEPLPENWIVDGDELPTTNSKLYPLAGALLPMAGHKGYGIALLIEVLTGVLGGGAFGQNLRSWVVGEALPVNQSHTFIAIDVAAFEPVAEFKERHGHPDSADQECTPRRVARSGFICPGRRSGNTGMNRWPADWTFPRMCAQPARSGR